MFLYVPPSVNTVLFINYNSCCFDMTHVTHFFSIFLAAELSVHEKLYTNGSPCLLRW